MVVGSNPTRGAIFLKPAGSSFETEKGNFMLSHLGQYPQRRMRRNRANANLRAMLAENQLAPHHLIWPIFVMEGEATRTPINTMPGIERITLDLLPEIASKAKALKIPMVAVFPYIEEALKTPLCEEAVNPDNLVCRAVRKLRALAPDLMILCDVALDPYNLDGHDGLYRPSSNGKQGVILNDETLELLCIQAQIQAEAGADTLGPSDMMDGRIGVIRRHLDQNGLQDIRLLSYAAKYASAFYGPFREAVGAGNLLKGDKRTYQMDPANLEEALHETALDLEEGADLVMVKPGLPYLDIIREVKATFKVPVFAYQVSGEYSALKLALDHGVINEQAIMETMLCFRRAGASAILTYFAPLVAEWLQDS